VSFSIDDIDYTVKLTDANLSTLATRLREALDLQDPLALFKFEALLDIQKLLNDLSVKPELKVIANTDFQERFNFLQTVNSVYLEAVADKNPNWKDNLTEEQKENVEAFNNFLISPSPIVEAVE